MKKRIFLAVCCTFCLSVTVCSAQKFRSDNYLGLSTGQWGTGGLIQTVNGFYKGPWFLGLGAGLDNYRFRSVPLFLSLTRDLPAFSKRSAFFVDLDAGTNLPWYTRKLSPYDGSTSSKFYSGLYWSASLGCKWKLSGQTGKALLLSAGYSMKKLREDQTAPSTLCTGPSPGPCDLVTQNYMYEYLNRTLFLTIGFQF